MVVGEGPAPFSPLFAAAADLGLKVGWLDLESAWEAPAPLAAAAVPGVLRAVAAAGAGSLALKVKKGPLVLKDLVREHFLGCELVCVHLRAAASSAEELLRSAPRLSVTASGYLVASPEGNAEELSSQELARRLRKRSAGPKERAREH